jgi:hypothetical protein
MRKSKIYRSSIIILSILFGFLVPTSADAVEDFSGDWSGRYRSETWNMRGGLFISLTQNGTIIGGTFTFYGALCGPIKNWPLTGNVNRNILSFNTSGNCGGRNIGFKVSRGVLTENTISADYTSFEDGQFHGKGDFYFTRSINYINATADNGGTIIPDGKISVTPGTDKTFNILANDRYKILDVIVDGFSIGAENSYTFYDVSANHAIMATFETAPNKTGSIVPSIVTPLLLDDE